MAGDYHIPVWKKGGTMVRVISGGFGTGTIVGHLQVTWYVKFK